MENFNVYPIDEEKDRSVRLQEERGHSRLYADIYARTWSEFQSGLITGGLCGFFDEVDKRTAHLKKNKRIRKPITDEFLQSIIDKYK